jgi:glycosyltransferase involved in cell wall biosynthesis
MGTLLNLRGLFLPIAIGIESIKKMNNTIPFFSICIPNFNYAGYIGQTIESVLQQDFADFEIIISDNASTDNSWEVIQQYVAKDARISAFQNTFNVGFAGNLQKSSERATGKYIIMLSSDDLMNDGALKCYYEIISHNKSQNIIVHSGFYTIDQDNNILFANFRYATDRHNDPSAVFHTELEYSKKEIWQKQIDGSYCEIEGKNIFEISMNDYRSPAQFCTTCFSKKAWEEVGGYDVDYNIMPDYVFLMKLICKPTKLIYVRSLLFSYRIHNQNQNSIQKKQKVLKKLIDDYLFTFKFPENLIIESGLKREHIIINIVNQWSISCINNFKFTTWLDGFRYFCFILSAYPWVAIKRLQFYKILFWIIASPLHLISYNFYKKIKSYEK